MTRIRITHGQRTIAITGNQPVPELAAAALTIWHDIWHDLDQTPTTDTAGDDLQLGFVSTHLPASELAENR